MTREEFKKLWENEDSNDIFLSTFAECAKEWGLFDRPKIHPPSLVIYKVLLEANVSDAEDWKPEE